MSRLDIAQACACAAMLIFSIGAGVSAMAYRDQAIDAQTQLRDLRARLARQQSEAATRLAELTHQRDAKQAELDTQHQQQEIADAAAQQEIARLAGELERSSVRVRIAPQPGTCGARSASASGDAAATAGAGAADAAQTYGLLPAANSRRLGAVIAEAETINAAYASCRARLLISACADANPVEP